MEVIKRKLVYDEGFDKVWEIYLDNELIAELRKKMTWITKPGQRIATKQASRYSINWKGKYAGARGEYGIVRPVSNTEILSMLPANKNNGSAWGLV